MHKSIERIFAKLHTIEKGFNPPPEKQSAHACMEAFLDYLYSIREKHCRSVYKDKYLVDIVFAKPTFMKKDPERTAYCRCHLLTAIVQLEKLFVEMKGKSDVITFATFKKFKDVIVDYLFGLKPIVEYLERKKDPEYVFFHGQKNYHMNAWEIFQSARLIQAQGIHKNIHLDQKSSQIASIFLLRQAMEVKFSRLIGVYFHDINGGTPRLKHDFHYKFIEDHIRFYDFKFVDFTLLQKIYDWCNVIVHGAFQPLPWQVAYAMQICAGLFMDGEHEGGWSMYGGIVVNDKAAMQQAFCGYFAASYDHGFWSTRFLEIEAFWHDKSDVL